jgi:hypothetical protein
MPKGVAQRCLAGWERPRASRTHIEIVVPSRLFSAVESVTNFRTVRPDDSFGCATVRQGFAPLVAPGFTITTTELTAVEFKMPEGNENKDTPRDRIYQAILLAPLTAIALLAPSGDRAK